MPRWTPVVYTRCPRCGDQPCRVGPRIEARLAARGVTGPVEVRPLARSAARSDTEGGGAATEGVPIPVVVRRGPPAPAPLAGPLPPRTGEAGFGLGVSTLLLGLGVLVLLALDARPR
ncbi:MAG TPA: hypothetical protein VNM66_03890 [Thermodesulfobacteriota bacterium]|nr:hypothetical protein [Thermodesulfobacteriota bacterium]